MHRFCHTHIKQIDSKDYLFCQKRPFCQEIDIAGKDWVNGLCFSSDLNEVYRRDIAEMSKNHTENIMFLGYISFYPHKLKLLLEKKLSKFIIYIYL